MPFAKIPGLPGEVYVPEKKNNPKKHPCKDCFRLNSISFYDIASQGRVFMDTAD